MFGQYSVGGGVGATRPMRTHCAAMTNGPPDRLVNFDFSPVFRQRSVCFVFVFLLARRHRTRRAGQAPVRDCNGRPTPTTALHVVIHFYYFFFLPTVIRVAILYVLWPPSSCNAPDRLQEQKGIRPRCARVPFLR